MAGKKKFGIHALSSELDDKGQQEVAAPVRPVAQKKVSSPINSPALAGTGKRIQRLYLDLPVSKESVECELVELEPGACVASPLNKRVQSLLDQGDAAVQQLLSSVREEGQRDPVLVRPLAKPQGDVRYEVIYGTRRRYVAELLSRERAGGFKLKAWVSDRISDPDAKRLADSENDDREAISAWERAVYFAGVKSHYPTQSTEVIAALEGVDRSLVARYLQLAELPEAVIRLVCSPSHITLRSGLDILRALKPLSASARTKLLGAVEQGERHASGVDLLKAMKVELAPKKAPASSKKKIELRDRDGAKRVIIGAHRSNKGQYKVDLFDVSDGQVEELQKALEKLLKL